MSEPASSLPAPPRRRLARLATAVAVLAFGLLVAYGLWWWQAKAALDNLISELSSAGEPVTLASLVVGPVAEERNGYANIRAAIALLDPVDIELQSDKPIRVGVKLPLSESQRLQLRELTRDGPMILAALAPARGKPQCVNDRLQLQSPAVSIALPELAPLRRLANLARRMAVLEMDAGRHEQALQNLRLIEPLAQGAASHLFLIGALAATGARSMAADGFMDFAPHLSIGASPGQAPPELVRACIADLLEETVARDEFLRALRAERVMQLDTLQSLLEGKLDQNELVAPEGTGKSLRTPPLISRPLLRSNVRFAAAQTGELIELLNSPAARDWPGIQAQLQPLEQ
ncbi:MAG: hypothetical protein NZ561_06580, partial [Phycisphaerae bacterium]|nr:hypothetical protein [Phycisphaerae bacterium]